MYTSTKNVVHKSFTNLDLTICTASSILSTVRMGKIGPYSCAYNKGTYSYIVLA